MLIYREISLLLITNGKNTTYMSIRGPFAEFSTLAKGKEVHAEGFTILFFQQEALPTSFKHGRHRLTYLDGEPLGLCVLTLWRYGTFQDTGYGRTDFCAVTPSVLLPIR